MKKTNTILLFLFAFVLQMSFAQQSAKGIKDAAVKGCGSCGMTGRLSASVGYGKTKISNANSINTLSFGVDYFHALKVMDNFSWGINAAGNYFSGNGNPFQGNLPAPYLVNAQISSQVTGSGNSKNSSYFAGVGPQFNFAFADRFVFSPIFQVGYLGVSQSEFKATQTTLVQGFVVSNYTKSYDLITQTETKTGGLGFIPKARLTYMISNSFGIWAEASYLLGPTVKSQVITFKPAQDPTLPPPNSYSVAQMDAGTYTTVANESKYNSVGFNFGLVYGLGKQEKKSVNENVSKTELPKDNSRPKSCFADANLIVDKFRCCNDSLIIEGHFDVKNLSNTIISSISITKINDARGNNIKNSLKLPKVITPKGVSKGYDYIFNFKIDKNTCKKDLKIEYSINTICTQNNIKQNLEFKNTKTIYESEIPCCNCDKTTNVLDDKTERKVANTATALEPATAESITARNKGCFAQANFVPNKFKCCEGQILVDGFFQIINSPFTATNTITITKIVDNKGNDIKNSLILPFIINPKSTIKGNIFSLELKLDNSACKKDVVIEYDVNAICTINKISKAVQYKNSTTILEKQLPCCGCDGGGLSDNNEPKCENNPIANGDFLDTPIIGGSMPFGKTPNWEVGYGTPKVNATQGCLDNGYVELSGNKVFGDAISQKLNSKILKGKKYKVTVAVKFNKGTQPLDYGKIRVIAYNGILRNIKSHPIPQADIAIIGRSPQVHDCGDWSFIELPIWKAHKDFDNIAINAFTNDDTISSSVLIDNVSFCETIESDCLELQVDASGNPIIPTNLGTAPPTFTCTTFDDDDDYFNGNLTDLYNYNGTWDMYEQNFSESSEQCFNIGGELPQEVTNYNCDGELQAEGITETCAEIETLINSVQNIPQEIHDYPLIAPLTNKPPGECKPNNLKEQMAFGGRDIIYVHGLEMSNIVDRAKGVKGAMTNWPDKTEFYGNGYYKGVAENNWKNHIWDYKLFKYSNRYLVVCYNSSQDAETAANSIMSQIRDAMQTGEGVVVTPGDLRIQHEANGDAKLDVNGHLIAECFGKEYVIISHSTGGMVADIMLSIANKTKNSGVEQTKYGNLGYISDRCKGHIAMHSAMTGSNVAAVAVTAVPKVAAGLMSTSLIAKTLTALFNDTNGTDFSTVSLTDLSTLVSNMNSFINSTILVDLSPKITYLRWASTINDVSVPVLTVSGNHPTGTPISNKIKILLKGLDDGVVNSESSSGRNQINPSIFSTFKTPKNIRAFDMGIPKTRASRFYLDQHKSNDLFYCNSSPFLSATGMLEPWSNISLNPQFNNHFTFLQSTDQHMMADDKMSCFRFGKYPETNDYFQSYNSEEELVVNEENLYHNGTINPLIINEMGEYVKDKTKNFPKFSVKIVRKGILIYPKICCTWIPRVIWKRTYHRLKDDKLLDMEYAYKYLFTN